MIPATAVPCITVLTAMNGNLFHFVATVAFAQLVETCIPLTALPPCLSNSFPALTTIVFSQSQNNSALFFYRIVPYSIVCFLLFAVSFSICSTNRTNPNSSLLALSPFFILLDAILNGIHNKLGFSFKKTKSFIYSHCKNGFYIYAKPNLCDPKIVSKYIDCYLGRPVIATSRIDAYDGNTVTFHYNRHEDNKFIVEKLPVLDFMERLIQHIPGTQFKMIRYYGIYARHREKDSLLFCAVSKEAHPFLLSFNKWRSSIITSFISVQFMIKFD